MKKTVFPMLVFPKDFEFVWPYFKSQRGKLFGAIISMLMSVPAAAIMSFLLKQFLDGKPVLGIWPLLGAAALFYALQTGSSQFGRFAIINTLMLLRTSLDVRKAQAREFGLLPASTFEAVPTDLEMLEEALRSTLEMVEGAIGVISYLLAMYLIGSYTGLAASAVPLSFCVPILLLYRALLKNGTAHRGLSSKGNRGHRLASGHTGIRDFIVNNVLRKDGRMSRFAHVYDILDKDIKVQKKISFQEGAIEWIARWGGIVAIVATFAIAGAVPGAGGIAIVILLERYGDALVAVFKGGSGVQRGHIAMERSIYKLLTLPQVEEASTTKKSFPHQGEVIVKNLSYSGVFKGISFKAYRSHPSVIEGPRGSGKTLMLEVLSGLRLPSSGYMAIDGEVWSAGELRRIVYPVFSSPFVNWELDTINSLFRSVKPEVNGSEIWDALKKVGGQKLQAAVLRLPMGLDTPLVDSRSGRKGLSEPEMYQIGLARAYIVEHPIICVDMPDRYSGFMQALKRLAKQKILIVTTEDAQSVSGISDQLEFVQLKQPGAKKQAASTTQVAHKSKKQAASTGQRTPRSKKSASVIQGTSTGSKKHAVPKSKMTNK